MADYTAAPNATNIEVLLKSSSFWPTDSTKILLARERAAIGAAGAAAQWDLATGWRPFIAPAVESPHTTRAFDGTSPDGFLDLKAGARSVSAITFDGRTLVPEEDYWLYEDDGVSLAFEPPYKLIRFLSVFNVDNVRRPGRLRVTARWGLHDIWPADAWQEVEQIGALIALTSIENFQNIASIGFDGFNKAFDVVGNITQKDLLVTWGKDFFKAASRHARVIG